MKAHYWLPIAGRPGWHRPACDASGLINRHDADFAEYPRAGIVRPATSPDRCDECIDLAGAHADA